MSKKILIVDTDRSFLLQLRNDLGQYRDHFGALLTENARAVPDAIKKHGVALVVADSQLELAGEPLPVALFRAGITLPVILLEDSRDAGKVDGWESCVVRTLPKPADSLSVANAALSVLDNEALEGLLHGVTSSSFFQFVEVEKKTCTIQVIQPGGDEGVLFFNQGQLMDAHIGEQAGLDAALVILAWEKVDLAILNFCPLKESRIGRSIGNLLLEAAVAQDHAAAEAKGINLDTEKAPAPSATLSVRQRLSALEGQDGIDQIVEDRSWDDLLALAETLAKDLEVGDPELCVLAGADGGGDIAVAPGEVPVAVHIGKFANRDVVVEKILATLETP